MRSRGTASTRTEPYLLFVGRITRQKGIIHLVNAIPEIDPGLQVVLCAGAPDTPEIGREMETRVAEVRAKRPGVVWIREMLPRAEVIQLYNHAAVFCCPSVYEPFGIINLEAMACETAVVASAVGGIPEVVVPEETGLLVDPRLVAGTFEPADPGRVLGGARRRDQPARPRPRAQGALRPRRPPPRGRAVQLGRHRAEDRRALPVAAIGRAAKEKGPLPEQRPPLSVMPTLRRPSSWRPCSHPCWRR